MPRAVARTAPPNGVAATDRRARTRLTAADLQPKYIPVLELENAEGETETHYGIVWGERIKGSLESAILSAWDQFTDDTGFVRDPARARQRLEDVVLLFVATLTPETVEMLSSAELRVILEDVNFLRPIIEPVAAEPGAEPPPNPPQAATTATT